MGVEHERRTRMQHVRDMAGDAGATSDENEQVPCVDETEATTPSEGNQQQLGPAVFDR